jgi:hypothetical protein
MRPLRSITAVILQAFTRCNYEIFNNRQKENCDIIFPFLFFSADSCQKVCSDIERHAFAELTLLFLALLFPDVIRPESGSHADNILFSGFITLFPGGMLQNQRNTVFSEVSTNQH